MKLILTPVTETQNLFTDEKIVGIEEAFIVPQFDNGYWKAVGVFQEEFINANLMQLFREGATMVCLSIKSEAGRTRTADFKISKAFQID